jgi:rubrerythrin
MKQPNELGLNRTGISTSPRLTAEMLRNMTPPSSAGSAATLFDLRREYLESADPVGTIPIPTSLRGIATTVMQRLKGDRPGVLLDKLGERAAFERTGTRLYDLLINKCLNQPGWQDAPLETFKTIRADEADHFALVAETIASLGGDPTVMTPGADVNGVMALGWIQVLADPRVTIPQCLQAILIAELADNEAWQMLIDLANEMELTEIAGRFTAAQRVEERHLTEIRSLYSQVILGDGSYIH